MLFILTHGHMPDINILVASLDLGHFFSWLKDSKKLAFMGHLFPGPRHSVYVSISTNQFTTQNKRTRSHEQKHSL